MKLTINGKEYGLQWGMGCFEIALDAMGLTVVTDLLDMIVMPNRDQDRATTNLFLGGLQNYAELNDLPFDLTYRKLQAFIDQAEQGLAAEISKDFFKSKYLGRTMYDHFGVQDPDTAEVKKKESPSAKSSKSATKSASNRQKSKSSL